MIDNREPDYIAFVLCGLALALLAMFVVACASDAVAWFASKVRRWRRVESADNQYTKEGESGE